MEREEIIDGWNEYIKDLCNDERTYPDKQYDMYQNVSGDHMEKQCSYGHKFFYN